MSEAAEALGISESTVRRRIHRGKLVGRREPYGHSFRWLVRFPCEVDDPRGSLRLVPALAETPAKPPMSASTRLIASLGRSDTAEVDAASAAQQALSMQELVPPPLETDSTSTLRPVPSASTRLIALLDRDDADADEQSAARPAPGKDAQPEQASRRAFWLAVVVMALALGTLTLEPPAWSRGVAIAVAALAAIMAMGEGAVGLWQAGSGEPERE